MKEAIFFDDGGCVSDDVSSCFKGVVDEGRSDFKGETVEGRSSRVV